MLRFTAVKLSSLDLNLLLVLHAVLEERSVTKAAKRLHVTPPAISNSLARLRDVLKDPLLVRTGRGLSPTPRALELGPLLREALAALEQVVEQGTSFEPASARRLFLLACTDADQLSLVPALVRALSARMPHATLQVISVDHLEALGGLERAEVDAAIAPAHPLPPGLHATVLYEDDAVLVVRRDHPTARRRLTRERFNALRHIDIRVALGEGGIGNRMAEAFFKQHGLVRDIAVAVPSFSAALMLAASTDLAAGVPRRLARTHASLLPLQLLDLPVPSFQFPMQLQWHERTHRDPGSRYFRERVVEAAREGLPGLM
jgi:DNA-binding transcriptional LysR family regulator